MKKLLVFLILGLMILPMVFASEPTKKYVPIVNYKVIGAFSNELPLGTCIKYIDENGFTKVYCKKIWFNTKEVVRVRI